MVWLSQTSIKSPPTTFEQGGAEWCHADRDVTGEGGAMWEERENLAGHGVSVMEGGASQV